MWQKSREAFAGGPAVHIQYSIPYPGEFVASTQNFLSLGGVVYERTIAPPRPGPPMRETHRSFYAPHLSDTTHVTSRQNLALKFQVPAYLQVVT